MRDINRIHPVCEKMETLWTLLPDWRFMQLICNIQRRLATDAFYMEDEDFEKLLNDLIDELKDEELV